MQDPRGGIVRLLGRSRKMARWKNRNRFITGTVSRLVSSAALFDGIFRFQLSLRDIEELLFERGVTVTYETIRCWCDKFGKGFAHRVKAARRKPGSTWHRDESASRTQARACGAVLKMGAGLPESACRGRLQTARCCCVQKVWW